MGRVATLLALRGGCYPTFTPFDGITKGGGSAYLRKNFDNLDPPPSVIYLSSTPAEIIRLHLMHRSKRSHFAKLKNSRYSRNYNPHRTFTIPCPDRVWNVVLDVLADTLGKRHNSRPPPPSVSWRRISSRRPHLRLFRRREYTFIKWSQKTGPWPKNVARVNNVFLRIFRKLKYEYFGA